MKTLFLTRHAHAEPISLEMPDFSRALTDEGKDEAICKGQFLYENCSIPQIIFSSPALRALTTAQLIAHEIHYPMENILETAELYEADVNVLLRLVHGIDAEFDQAMFITHNPAVTEFASYLTDDALENMPPCSVYAIQFDCENWSDILPSIGRKLFFSCQAE